jgi:hypothetical protein
MCPPQQPKKNGRKQRAILHGKSQRGKTPLVALTCMMSNRWLHGFQSAVLIIVVAAIGSICHAQQKNDESTKPNDGKNTSPNITVVVKQENPPHVTDDENQKNEDIRIQKKLTDFTGGLVVVGLLQALVLGFTAWLIKRQADQMVEAGQQTERVIAQMRDTTERQLRAYVGITSASARMINKNTLAVIVCIKNFGQTPAHKLRHVINYRMAKHPLNIPLEAVIDSDTGTESTVFPDTPLMATASVDLEKEPLTEGMTMFVYGKIVYEDIFKNKQWTTYRYFFPAPNTVVTLVVGQEYPLTVDTRDNESKQN